MNQDNYCDVVIIGGGPAGSTAGALLSSRGWKVTLFEAAAHPRFHIGESLLPMNLPILEQLGLLDDVRRIGTFKPGADFTVAGENAGHHTFAFNRALRDSPKHAFQVKRSEFDSLLAQNCAARGTNFLENHKVSNVTLESAGLHRVQVKSSDGQEHEWQCRYVIDASGQQALLASQNRWRTRNQQHASAAIFAHFENVEHRTGTDAGNISIYWIDAGWIWMIPLSDGLMSIGAVCSPEYLKQREGSQEDFLLATIRRSEPAAERVRPARLVSEARVAANYSYYSRRHVGKGYALIGDAYAFIDPVFSSGVFLAMSGGAEIVAVTEAWLNHQSLKYRYLKWRYERKMRSGLDMFSWFIYRFNTPTMSTLFRNPRNIFKVEQAVTSVLAGDVFRGGTMTLRIWLFKLIFATTKLINSRQRPDTQYD